MASTSDANSRVVEVLDFLASHPTERFTLSEIASQLGLSNGTAHRMLLSLTRARYLNRHPKHKTYTLGVALVAIGQAALEQHRGVEVARREMLRLTEELKAQCWLTTIVDDEMLFVAKAGAPHTDDELYQIGERRLFLPPLGLLHIAWTHSDQRSSYLDTAEKLLSEAQFTHIKRSLAWVREHGYAIAAHGDSLRVLGRVARISLDRKNTAGYLARLHKLVGALSLKEIALLDVDAAKGAEVAYITAPIFSPQGTVAFEIALSGLPDKLTTEEIEHYIRRLRVAASVVTSETFGRAPR